MQAVMDLDLSLIESLDVDDLLTLPDGFRYELHTGNLVIMSPPILWHQLMGVRVVQMFSGAGFAAIQDCGVRGDRPRDCRVPDFGVFRTLPDDVDLAYFPGSAYRLVGEVVSEHTPNDEYTDKMAWYAKCGISEYWVVDRTPDRARDDALVSLYRLAPDEKYGYALDRQVLLSELEAEWPRR